MKKTRVFLLALLAVALLSGCEFFTTTEKQTYEGYFDNVDLSEEIAKEELDTTTSLDALLTGYVTVDFDEEKLEESFNTLVDSMHLSSCNMPKQAISINEIVDGEQNELYKIYLEQSGSQIYCGLKADSLSVYTFDLTDVIQTLDFSLLNNLSTTLLGQSVSKYINDAKDEYISGGTISTAALELTDPTNCLFTINNEQLIKDLVSSEYEDSALQAYEALETKPVITLQYLNGKVRTLNVTLDGDTSYSIKTKLHYNEEKELSKISYKFIAEKEYSSDNYGSSCQYKMVIDGYYDIEEVELYVLFDYSESYLNVGCQQNSTSVECELTLSFNKIIGTFECQHNSLHYETSQTDNLHYSASANFEITDEYKVVGNAQFTETGDSECSISIVASQVDSLPSEYTQAKENAVDLFSALSSILG